MPKFDQVISEYYGKVSEGARLEQGAFLLEALRTRELIERHMPTPPAVVLDVGGAAGAYALWLAAAGHRVHLVDPVARHVNEAKRSSAANPRPIASCAVGDARSLDFDDSIADAVLMLGPLYHLTEVEDRRMALSEAARVLRTGGVLFAAGISRFASVLDGVARELFEDARFTAIAERDLLDGQHRNDTERPDYFTTAYFHRPGDLRAEVAAAGFDGVTVFGIEGPGWILPDVAERLADGHRREHLLRAAQMVEVEPEMVGASAHILAVGQKK